MKNTKLSGSISFLFALFVVVAFGLTTVPSLAEISEEEQLTSVLSLVEVNEKEVKIFFELNETEVDGQPLEELEIEDLNEQLILIEKNKGLILQEKGPLAEQKVFTKLAYHKPSGT